MTWWRRTSLRVAPFPAGKEFAVTFVDDTDLSTRANTEPVYDFLWRHRIFGTKTVWVNRQQRTSDYRRDLERPVDGETFSGSTLEDPDYLAFVRQLAERGYEIALHGVAAGNSYRDEIAHGLEKFRDWFGGYPRINIFHERNIENLYAGYHKLDLWPFKWHERFTHHSDYLGHVEGSPYFWGDLAREKITYMRVPFHTIRAVNTLRWNPGMPFRDSRRPYVNYWFSNSDGSDCQRFNELLSADNLARLAREGGACIVYTHFAKGFAVKRADRHELDPGFVATVERLAGFDSAWFPTTSVLLDRLRALRQIVIRQVGQELTLSNRSGQDIADLALFAPGDVMLEDEHGRPCGRSVRGTIAVGPMRANATRRFRSNRHDSGVHGGSPERPIGRWERARLEVLNYVGMLKK